MSIRFFLCWTRCFPSALAFPIMILGGLLMNGCATTDDPHEGGFINGVANLGSGGYQKRVDSMETTYQGEVQTQKDLKYEAEQLAKERTRVNSRLEYAYDQMDYLKEKIERKRTILASSSGSSSAAAKRKLAQVDQEAASVERQMWTIKPPQASAQELDRQSEMVTASLDKIDELIAIISE